MRKLIILSHVGTSDIKAYEELLLLYKDCISKYETKKVDVKLAFSKKRAIEALAIKGIVIEEIDKLLEESREIYEKIDIIPIHLIEGESYQSLKIDYKNVTLRKPLLYDNSKISRLAKAIYKMIKNKEAHVLFIGHGNNLEDDSYYEVFVDEFRKYAKADFFNIKSKINVESENIVIFPLFSISGYHVKKDVLEGEESVLNKLKRQYEEKDLPLNVEVFKDGLLSYENIRKIYLDNSKHTQVAVIGVSYKNADVLLRGMLSFTTSKKKIVTKELKDKGVEEIMIVSTCNRSEIYVATKNINNAILSVKEIYNKLAKNNVDEYLYIKTNKDALTHLYKVVTGIDSIILLEDEILGQIKSSLEVSNELESTKKYLNKIVRQSITFAKKQKHELKYSENKLSLASISIDYLKNICNGLEDKNILMIGTGEMGKRILKYLMKEKKKELYLTNRTYNRGFDEKTNKIINDSVIIIEYEKRYEYLKEVDIVISATSSPHTIINRDVYERFDKEMIFLDMAVPRDIDPSIDALDKVQVITVDTFKEIAKKHIDKRKKMAEIIEKNINEEVEKEMLWIKKAESDVIIKSFHKMQETIIKSKLEQIKKLNLDKSEEAILKEIIRSSTWDMIKDVVKKLNNLGEEELDYYNEAVKSLFDIKDEV